MCGVVIIMNVLFICTANIQRSRTAEDIFKDHHELDVRSAGVDPLADEPLTREHLEWADKIFVMEDMHEDFIFSNFRDLYSRKELINLKIPDVYEYMEEGLVKQLKEKVVKYL